MRGAGQNHIRPGLRSDICLCHLSSPQDCSRRRAVILKFSLQGIKIYSGEGEVGGMRAPGSEDQMGYGLFIVCPMAA